MTLPQTQWHYDTQTEMGRIVHTAHNVANGFYALHGFPVVSGLKPSYAESRQAVILPDLPYHEIPRFWDQVARVHIYRLPLRMPSELVVGLSAYIATRDDQHEPLIQAWEQAAPAVLTELQRILPRAREVETIHLMPSQYGTICSFDEFDPESRAIWAYVRDDDGSVGSIVEAIVSSLIFDQVHLELSGNWTEGEMVADWLLTKSSLADILSAYDPGYQSTLQTLRKKQLTELSRDSSAYMARLGFSATAPLVELRDGVPTKGDVPLTDLSQQQTEILSHLVQHGEISHDQLASIMFATEEDYSLYAMAKQMERLRKKLEFNGISGSYIKTVRGFGYRV